MFDFFIPNVRYGFRLVWYRYKILKWAMIALGLVAVIFVLVVLFTPPNNVVMSFLVSHKVEVLVGLFAAIMAVPLFIFAAISWRVVFITGYSMAKSGEDVFYKEKDQFDRYDDLYPLKWWFTVALSLLFLFLIVLVFLIWKK